MGRCQFLFLLPTFNMPCLHAGFTSLKPIFGYSFTMASFTFELVCTVFRLPLPRGGGGGDYDPKVETL